MGPAAEGLAPAARKKLPPRARGVRERIAARSACVVRAAGRSRRRAGSLRFETQPGGADIRARIACSGSSREAAGAPPIRAGQLTAEFRLGRAPARVLPELEQARVRAPAL